MRTAVFLALMFSGGVALAANGGSDTGASSSVPTQTIVPPVERVGEAQDSFVRDVVNVGHTAGGRDVEEVILVPQAVAVLKVSGPLTQVSQIFAQGFERMQASLTGAGIKFTRPPLALYTSIDEMGFMADLMVPLEGGTVDTPPSASLLPAPLSVGKSPEGKALRLLHVGDLAQIEEAYADLETFVDDKSIALRDVFLERYVSDPATVAIDQQRTQIYVLIQ